MGQMSSKSGTKVKSVKSRGEDENNNSGSTTGSSDSEYKRFGQMHPRDTVAWERSVVYDSFENSFVWSLVPHY